MTIGLLSAGCIFGGALLGLLLQGLLPEGHLRDNTGDLHPSLIPCLFLRRVCCSELAETFCRLRGPNPPLVYGT